MDIQNIQKLAADGGLRRRNLSLQLKEQAEYFG
jgi:hypothetical protein